MVRPLASRNVVVPFESVVAVPVVRPDPSRNVFVPLLSVVAVPVIWPCELRNVVVCAEAPVADASTSAMTSLTIAASPNLEARSSLAAHRARNSRMAVRRHATRETSCMLQY